MCLAIYIIVDLTKQFWKQPIVKIIQPLIIKLKTGTKSVDLRDSVKLGDKHDNFKYIIVKNIGIYNVFVARTRAKYLYQTWILNK